MRKLLWTEDEEHFNNNHPGCISSVFPVLDHQNWHFNVKKILSHRKHARQQKGNVGILHDQDSFEASQLSAGNRSLIQADKSTQKHKKRGRMLQRTYSIHHLESDEWVHSTISSSQNVNNEDDTNQEIKDYVDISEISQVSLRKAKLTKSGSFPSMLGTRKLRPTKLKHKLNEFYSVPKKGSDNWARKLDLSKLESLMIKLDQQDGKNIDDDFNNDGIKSIKRTCSLNERTNRYAQLLDNGDTKEAMLYNFRSLKLTDALHNDFFELPIQEEGGQKTKNIKSNSSSQEEIHQLEIQFSEGLKPSSEVVKNNIKSVNTHEHNDEYFNYVRQILEKSGFIKNGFEQTWYASNKLLNPSVFQEIESQYPYDPESFKEEVIDLSHHLHRFELVEETLLRLYERSFSYYPKTLSCSCHLSPAPSGNLVLEEVWKSVSRLMKLKPDMDQSFESIVCWDLRVGDEWMNLQMESECIALELEDMIFNELLVEVLLCS